MSNNAEMLLRDVQAKSFLAHDILLYLDTHPEDKAAFAAYQCALKERREAVRLYQQQAGALQTDAQLGRTRFDWADGGYPWQ